MEERIAYLESDVRHIQADMLEMKTDIRDLSKKVDGMHESLSAKIERVQSALSAKFDGLKSELASAKIWALFLAGTVLAVLARGFKWI